MSNPVIAAPGLSLSSDTEPGIRRPRAGSGFRYVGSGVAPVSAATRARIRDLAIPPAWEKVWICPSTHGHIQATGCDSRGRKQCIYHPRWTEVREAVKYSRLAEFGRALPTLRRRVRRDLMAPVASRPAVLAAMVSLLDTTYVRVGNRAYADANSTFGLTTLRTRHAAVRGSHLLLTFPGKAGVPHRIEVENARIARLVKRCQELPGQELFCYRSSDKSVKRLDSADLNDYLRNVTGLEVSAKDFRTWGGSVAALKYLAGEPAPAT